MSESSLMEGRPAGREFTWATMAVCPGQQGPQAPLQVRQMGQESQLQVQPWTPAEVPPSQSCALVWIPGRGRVKKMGLEQMGRTRPLDRQRSCHGVGRSDGLIHLMNVCKYRHDYTIAIYKVHKSCQIHFHCTASIYLGVWMTTKSWHYKLPIM